MKTFPLDSQLHSVHVLLPNIFHEAVNLANVSPRLTSFARHLKATSDNTMREKINGSSEERYKRPKQGITKAARITERRKDHKRR